MLRDRRFWYWLAAIPLLAFAHAYIQFGWPLPHVPGAKWYVLPAMLALFLTFPIFGKDWQPVLALNFMVFVVISASIGLLMWPWRYTDVDPRLIDWIVQSFNEALTMSTPRGGMFLTGWVLVNYLIAIAFLRTETHVRKHEPHIAR